VLRNVLLFTAAKIRNDQSVPHISFLAQYVSTSTLAIRGVGSRQLEGRPGGRHVSDH
jgi:hypothetical protein